MICKAVALLLCLGLPVQASVPPGVEEMLAPLQAAERSLQDATLSLAAARRDAEPAAAAVAAARSNASGWLGRWRLRRALVELKRRLDKVEMARVERAAARERLFLLLTAVEEEARVALERGLAGKASPEALVGWWKQEQAWSRRLEALEAAPREATDPPSSTLMAQARVEQLERDGRVLESLRRRALLPPQQAQSDARILEERLRRWRRAAAAPSKN